MTKEALIEDFMNRPYHRLLCPADDGGFVAYVVELSGCTAHGPTEQSALDALRNVQRAWIVDAMEHEGAAVIPQPHKTRALLARARAGI